MTDPEPKLLPGKKREPIFLPGGLLRLVGPAIMFAIAVALVYYRDNPFP